MKRIRLDADNAWARYEPSAQAPWNRARVAHLHRRAGFSADWATLERDLKAGPDAAVSAMLDGAAKSLDGQDAAAFEHAQNDMDRYASATGNLGQIQAAWLYRLVFTPTPLRERLTLFWHDHFATSHAKVNSTQLMADQIALLRTHALGSFSALLKAIARDPAMLIWLDSSTNRKAHPNENYAREVMELFALGRGNYSEKDIQEAARAFTGSFIQGDRFKNVPAQHDDGPKTILGKTGPFRGDDVADILLDQDACATFVCRKLITLLVNEIDPPDAALVKPVADTFRQANYEMRAPVEMILRSRLFFDSASLRKRVKSPVEFLIGTIRSLEILKPTVSLDALAETCAAMGQSLFAPPSVAGWDGGTAWINTASSLARANFVLALLNPADEKLGGRLDPLALARRHSAASKDRIASFFNDLLLQDALEETARARIASAFQSAFENDVKLREAVSLLLTSPEYQLA